VVTEGLNAAEIYLKAFDWARGLGWEDSARIRQPATVAIDDKNVVALIEQASTVLEAIRTAATIDRCDWGIETVTSEDQNDVILDRLYWDVVNVACLSARRHANSGRGLHALNNIFAALKLAHRWGTGGLFLARALECVGEVSAFQTLGRILPELQRATRDDLAQRLNALPSPELASASIGPESRFILGSRRDKLTEMRTVIEGADWESLGFSSDEAAVLQRLTGGDRDKLLAHLESTRAAFIELGRRLDGPRPNCRAALDEFAKAEQSTHPLAAAFVEQAWSARHVVDRMRALRSMLHAGIILYRDGAPAFQLLPDPFGTGPFELERRGKGYLIRSALRDYGKPEVSLEIGDVPRSQPRSY